MSHQLVLPDRWNALRGATPARIALGRAGGSLPVREWLEFKAAHAAARDAVHNEFHAEQLASEIAGIGIQTIVVDTAARDRLTFLQRPDLGCRLDDASREKLLLYRPTVTAPAVAVCVSDGLSAAAVHRQVPPLLQALVPLLQRDRLSLAPIVIAHFGRVALQDQIGQLLGAQLALMLIGERPGLGSPDSLGAYLVYDPKPGNMNANRNCVSNIRPEGLRIAAAADTIRYLINEAIRRQLSGVKLKDERGLALPATRSAITDSR
jgi:ethanolamine ammonia-lyase small subunit